MSVYKNISIVTIDDDPVIRACSKALIDSNEGYFVSNCYRSFEEAIETIADDYPDVILMDIELPGINGIDAIPLLKKKIPSVHVLILTAYDMEYQVFSALSNGASGYLTKDSSTDSLISSITEVMEGGAPMSSQIARMVIQSMQRNYDTPLSKREVQVLELISLGKRRAQIANELFIELGTVKSHIKNIYTKLEVNSKEKALKAARDAKLIK